MDNPIPATCVPVTVSNRQPACFYEKMCWVSRQASALATSTVDNTETTLVPHP